MRWVSSAGDGLWERARGGGNGCHSIPATTLSAGGSVECACTRSLLLFLAPPRQLSPSLRYLRRNKTQVGRPGPRGWTAVAVRRNVRQGVTGVGPWPHQAPPPHRWASSWANQRWAAALASALGPGLCCPIVTTYPGLLVNALLLFVPPTSYRMIASPIHPNPESYLLIKAARISLGNKRPVLLSQPKKTLHSLAHAPPSGPKLL